MAEYTAVYGDKISSSVQEKIKFTLWIYNKLQSSNPKDFHCQLLLIREYGNFFLRPYAHLPQFKNLNEGQGLQILPKEFGNEFYKVRMKELWDASRKALSENCPVLTSRIPINPKQKLTNLSVII